MASLTAILVTAIISATLADPLVPQIRRLTAWMSGEYDNSIQHQEDIVDGIPEAERHALLHSLFVPINVKALRHGSNLYVEQYINSGSSPYRQRLYSFVAEKQTIRTKIYSFADPSKYLSWRNGRCIFEDIPLSELTNRPECDVTWVKKGDVFVSDSVGDQCVINFIGQQVRVLLSTNLTDSYCTISEEWLRISDNEKIIGSHIPYLMNKTKDILSPRHILKKTCSGLVHGPVPTKGLADIDRPKTIDTFFDVTTHLFYGHRVYYTADLSGCQVEADADHYGYNYGDYVDVYEMFNDSRIRPQAYLAFSNKKFHRNANVTEILLREVRVFDDERVTFHLSHINPATLTLRAESFAYCRMYSNGLKVGRTVRMTSYYQYCDGIDVNAVGGGELRAYEFIGDDVEVTFEAFIGNYKTGEGYAYNHVIGHFMSNGSITFTATLDDAITFIPLYVNSYRCKIDSGYFDGEISFFLS